MTYVLHPWRHIRSSLRESIPSMAFQQATPIALPGDAPVARGPHTEGMYTVITDGEPSGPADSKGIHL